MKKILNKTLVILILAILFLNMASNIIYGAIEVDLSKAYIQKIGTADYHLKYYNKSSDSYYYLVCSIVGYYDDDDNFNPAYCMNRDLAGAEEESYYVKTESLLKNDKVWRVIKNGYPYKSAKKLGLNSKYDAYAVTKWAVYCILGESNIDRFYADEDDEEAVAMLKALKKLVDIGENGKEKQKEDPLSIVKDGSMQENEKYVYQDYKVNSETSFEVYKISNVTGLPDGAYIASKSGKKTKTFDESESFRVMIPKDKITKDIDIKITAKAECEAYVILEGKTTVTNTQNYVVTAGEMATATASANLKISANQASIEVNKIAEDTKKALSGVTFELYKGEKLIDTKTTDSKGKVKFTKLVEGTYTLLETKTNTKYVLNKTPVKVTLGFNEDKKITVTNTVQKGNLKVVKLDADDKKTPIEGTKFELYNSNKKKVGTYTTDKNGIIEVKDLPIGKYTLKEIKTNKLYNLEEKEIEVNIEYNKTTTKTVTNTSKKGQIKVVKVDKDDNEIKLEGVKFNVQDEKGNILETLITDKKGEAITNKFALKDYQNLFLQEIETNNKYNLNNKIAEIKLEENQIKQVVIENEKIKGKIKIVKTSKDDNKLNGKKAGSPLQNVEFAIYDEKGILVQNIKTDSKGIAISKDLEKGKYTIKETKTDKNYYLNTDAIEVNIVNNGEIVTKNITNESKKPELDVEKSGPEKANAGDEISYDLSVRNTGNTILNDFTMEDIIPAEYINVTKFKTGTYNQNLNYNLYYKTNKTKTYKLLMEGLNSTKNYEIDFEKELSENEYITGIKLNFGKVDIGFCSNENPNIKALVRTSVKNNDKFTNNVILTANFENHKLKDKSKRDTVVKKILPKTGF